MQNWRSWYSSFVYYLLRSFYQFVRALKPFFNEVCKNCKSWLNWFSSGKFAKRPTNNENFYLLLLLAEIDLRRSLLSKNTW